jgi:hypothetical protein
VIAQPLGAEHRKPRMGQDDEAGADEGGDGAHEQHLADRIGLDEPLGERAAAREDHGRHKHVKDAERDVLLPDGALFGDLRFRIHRYGHSVERSGSTLQHARKGLHPETVGSIYKQPGLRKER